MSQMRPALKDPVEYRKSGLSLNHIVGCPLDCAYCVRHLFDGFAMREPKALLSDDAAVEYLVSHRYFTPHRTPLQIFNRATDPFLPQVKPHTFAVLENLDGRGLRNHVLIITRYRVTEDDCRRINELASLRVTLLFTYSGIDDLRIEPVASSIAAESLKIAFESADRYRTVLYWRPIIPGLNDTDGHLSRALALSHHAHATVFTGLFYRDEIRAHYRVHGLHEPYDSVARRKILPAAAEARILEAFAEGAGSPLFRKTSCGACFAHGLPDYNGHFGIKEVCDICPSVQIGRCARAHHVPTREEVLAVSERIGDAVIVEINDQCAILDGFSEQQRYFLQHALAFQFHDLEKPHHLGRHGRAEVGWEHVNLDTV